MWIGKKEWEALLDKVKILLEQNETTSRNDEALLNELNILTQETRAMQRKCAMLLDKIDGLKREVEDVTEHDAGIERKQVELIDELRELQGQTGILAERWDNIVTPESLKAELIPLAQLRPMTEKVLQLNTKVGEVRESLLEIEHLQSSGMKQVQNMFWATKKSGSIREAQKNFWESYPRATGDLAAVQQANLILMKKLRQLCVNHNITMWLSGGTLIGALRHKGFIPWDDDVDVCMLRSDLEKLKSLLSSGEFYIREYFHDRACAKGYQFCYRDQRIPNFVDICAFDRCTCNSLTERINFLEKIRELRVQMQMEFVNRLGAPAVCDVGLSHFGPYDEETKEKVKQLMDQYQEKVGDFGQGNCLFYGIDNYPFGYPVMEADSILQVKEVPFEDTVMDVPWEPERYLQGYGDIWQIPPDMGMSMHIYAFSEQMDTIYRFLENEKHSISTGRDAIS